MFAVAKNRPHFIASEGTRLAREMFGVSGDAQELPSERDQNFCLCTKGGEKFVLKIASAADSIEVLDLQNKAMAHIAAQAPSIHCPRVCPALSGEQIVRAAGPGGRSHFVRMLTYIPGKFFAHVRPHSPELLRSLGPERN